ncbi:MAG: hypothetical protein R3350_07610, partial [Saprospiraceae bacterium]|nr:hypothetical protein [Saprospiraceae bacterium]
MNELSQYIFTFVLATMLPAWANAQPESYISQIQLIPGEDELLISYQLNLPEQASYAVVEFCGIALSETDTPLPRGDIDTVAGSGRKMIRWAANPQVALPSTQPGLTVKVFSGPIPEGAKRRLGSINYIFIDESRLSGSGITPGSRRIYTNSKEDF